MWYGGTQPLGLPSSSFLNLWEWIWSHRQEELCTACSLQVKYSITCCWKCFIPACHCTLFCYENAYLVFCCSGLPSTLAKWQKLKQDIYLLDDCLTLAWMPYFAFTLRSNFQSRVIMLGHYEVLYVQYSKIIFYSFQYWEIVNCFIWKP